MPIKNFVMQEDYQEDLLLIYSRFENKRPVERNLTFGIIINHMVKESMNMLAVFAEHAGGGGRWVKYMKWWTI